jgi:hypothetical protein
MSTALITALRESCGYLRDDGYDQTAQLMALAADEIERLNREVQVLEANSRPGTPARGPMGHLRRFVRGTRPAARLTGTVPRENRT